MMKKIAAAALCAALTCIAPCASADTAVSVTDVDGNIIKCSVSADSGTEVISALYSGGRLYEVHTGTGSKTFYAPPGRSCTIKTYTVNKTDGSFSAVYETDAIETGHAPYLERLILFLPDEALQKTAEIIHNTAGGDMAWIGSEMVLNPELYDTVFILYTSENGALDARVQKLFDTYNFGTATLVPLCAGEVNDTDRYISTLEPLSIVHEAIDVRNADEQDIIDYLNETVL